MRTCRRTILPAILALLVASFSGAAPGARSGSGPEPPPIESGAMPLRYDRAKIRRYSTGALLSFFTLASQKANAPAQVPYFFSVPVSGAPQLPHLLDVENELVRRGAAAEALAVSEHPIDPAQQAWAIRVLGRIAGAEVEARLHEIGAKDESDAAHMAVRALAVRGDPWALERLVRVRFARSYGPYSLLWAEDIALLGRHRYRPAAYHLVDATHSYSLDVVDAALTALGSIFPEARRDFHDLVEAREYWEHYVSRFSYPGVCRFPEKLSGIELRAAPAGAITARSDAWANLLAAAEVCDTADASAGAHCPRAFTNDRQRYLLVEVCEGTTELERGLHFIAVDADPVQMPWPTAPIGDPACRADCEAPDDCVYSVRSDDGKNFTVQYFEKGSPSSHAEFRILEDGRTELSNGCVCDFPC